MLKFFMLRYEQASIPPFSQAANENSGAKWANISISSALPQLIYALTRELPTPIIVFPTIMSLFVK